MAELKARHKGPYRPLSGPIVCAYAKTGTGHAEAAAGQAEVHAGQAEAAATEDEVRTAHMEAAAGGDGTASGGTGTEADAHDFVRVREIGKQVITDCETIPATNGICGGVVCTGFIDVEKIIFPGYCKPPVFLEKKLPFQILLLTLDS